MQGTVEASELQHDVRVLAEHVGERNLRDQEREHNLHRAERYITEVFQSLGLAVLHQHYVANSRVVSNIEAEVCGSWRSDEILVVGAHYDSATGSPGAEDNASGIAALLALARAWSHLPARAKMRTVRFVAFTNEELPFTRTPQMGSYVYAQSCRERGDRVIAMLSLESLGRASSGGLVSVISNFGSRALAHRVATSLGRGAGLHCRKIIGPGMLPALSASDHWSFWKHGYPGVMVTESPLLGVRSLDGAGADKLDFAQLQKVVHRLADVVDELASG
jgi:Zn-dependent M28 family amino/carboxypeptidase